MSPARRALRRMPWLVAAFAVVAYGAAVGGNYLFDDVHSVAANTALVEPGATMRALTDPSAFSATGKQMYRPVVLLSFVWNLAVSTSAWSPKLGNVLLHALVAAMLFGWLRALRARTRVAFVVAAVFAVHPLASEAVNLVSARSELLLGVGALLALRCHLAWHRGRGGWGAIAGTVLGTAIACGSKETGAVVPAMLVAQAVFTRRSGDAGAGRGRAVAGVLPAVVAVVVYLALRKALLGEVAVDVLGRTGGDPIIGHNRTLTQQLATMGPLLARALLQAVAPFGLSLDPPVTYRTSLFDPWSLLAWSSLVGLFVAAVVPGTTAGRRRLGVCVAVLFAAPWVIVPLNMPLAEHRLYGPMLGFALVAACVRWRRPVATTDRGWSVRAIVVPALLVVGTGLSIRRTLEYRDDVTMWNAEIAARPTAFHAWFGLGTSYLARGDAEHAVEPLATAHCLRPQVLESLRSYTEALVSVPEERADPAVALARAEELAAKEPNDPWARTLLARAHLIAGRRTGDTQHFAIAEERALSCLSIAAPKAFVFLLAADAKRCAGDVAGAIEHLDESLRRGLVTVPVRLERVRLLRMLGRDGEARRELARAQAMAPMDPAVMGALREAAQPPR
ncbi:MAG: hypothetical protein JNK78_10570 [Planctomycetes bacterium]|nr:hypothetical protein [Planctomycetota bacterium]